MEAAITVILDNKNYARIINLDFKFVSLQSALKSQRIMFIKIIKFTTNYISNGILLL